MYIHTYIVEAVIKSTGEETSELLTKHISTQLNKYSSIRLQAVRYYLSKRDAIQVTYKTKASNSCVYPDAKFDFEIGILDMESKGATSNARYGLVSIGNLIRFSEDVPINNRTPEAMIDGLRNVFISMGKQQQLFR